MADTSTRPAPEYTRTFTVNVIPFPDSPNPVVIETRVMALGRTAAVRINAINFASWCWRNASSVWVDAFTAQLTKLQKEADFRERHTDRT
jgi:hypothetical protein